VREWGDSGDTYIRRDFLERNGYKDDKSVYAGMMMNLDPALLVVWYENG
jgi:hypothetical protein